MPAHLQWIVMAATVGSGLMAGLLFAFSVAVMRALLTLAPEAGMLAMQRINLRIVNAPFLLLFLGTALLCLGLAVVGVRGLPAAGAAWLLAGAVAYLVGPLGITLLCNVPLNNRLAALAPHQAAAAWPAWVAAWVRWNHVRTLLSAVASVCLCMGLALGARGA